MDRTSRRTWAWGITLCAAAAAICALPFFFQFIQQRPGSMPFDPLLERFSPIDLSTPIFLVLYGTLAACLVFLARRPAWLLRVLQAYLILLVLRMLCMTLITLEPPVDLIPLIDPVTQVFYPDSEPFAKDLFFSGHTATMFLLTLAISDRRWKRALLVATVFIGSAVIAQHVHWTIDVIAAPVATWLAWCASAVTMRRSAGATTSSSAEVV